MKPPPAVPTRKSSSHAPGDADLLRAKRHARDQHLQLGLLAGWGTGPKGAFCSRLVAIVVPDVHVPHGRLNNNGALVAVKTLRAVTNAFGPPAKWLSRSRATPLSGQWPLVGDKGVIIAGGPQNISGDIRRDDEELLVVAATDRVNRRNF